MNIRITHFKLLTILLVVVPVSFTSCESSNSNSVNEHSGKEKNDGLSYLFREQMEGYDVYRIPAIVKTTEGTLLAFAEARKEKSNGDSGNIDLVLRRSEDEGETWSDMITVWDEGENTAGNPVPVVDSNTGTIHLLMTWNHGDDDWSAINNGTGKDTRRIFHTSSEDDGLTWQDPVEITSDIKKTEWRWYGTGPVHGIQIKEGDYKGRLVVPSYFTVMEEGERKSYSHMIISDDGGQTWQPGNRTPRAGVGECTVAELFGGKLILNMRSNEPSVTMRMISMSMDGGETWSDVQTDYDLVDPKCQASLLSFESNNEDMLFFANAASTERTNMTIQMSRDGGKNWEERYEIYEGPSAYSDLVKISDNTIGIVYEGGIGRPYEGIAFEIISLEEFE